MAAKTFARWGISLAVACPLAIAPVSALADTQAPVNPQVTDSVAQTNVKVVGEAPAVALGSIYQSMGHSTGILYANAINSQQQLAVTNQATTQEGVEQLYASDAVTGRVVTHATVRAVACHPFGPPANLTFCLTSPGQ